MDNSYVDRARQSRIDIIGQNGNDGLHYKEDNEKEFLKKLVADHWNYIAGVLAPHDIPNIHEIEFHYKTAMEHGWRHAKEYFTGHV